MPFRRNRRTTGAGPNPGLTPIDDIHGASRTPQFEPDHTTGRLRSQDDDESAATEKRDRMSNKKSKKR